MSSVLDVSLMGRDYRVACPADERDALLAAVALVDGKMHELAAQTRVSGERLVVMAALNIAHELLQVQQSEGTDTVQVRQRIGALRTRIDEALARQEQLF